MTRIDYKKVKCPKCGKSYFSVKENSGLGITNLVFQFKPDPIYKDGELQNPTEAEPIKERCKCLECGCNFRVETYDVFGEYKFIDEDEEGAMRKIVLENSLKNLQTKHDPEPQLVIDSWGEVRCENGSLKVNDTSSVAIKSFQEVVEERLEEIEKRLAKLEEQK